MGKHRKHGEGTIETRTATDGTKLYRVRMWTQGKRVNGPWTSTPRQARDAFGKEHGEKRERSSTKQTFATFAQNWLELRMQSRQISPTTAMTYSYNVKALKKDPLGSIPVDQIKETDLKAWMIRQTVKPITIARRIGFYHEVLSYAGNHTKIRPPKVTQSERRPLSATERTKLPAVLKGATERQKLAILIYSGLGVSRSEACGLMHEDRDGDGIWVNRVVVIGEDEVHIRRKKKTDRRHRWIPLPDYLKDRIGPECGSGYVLGTDKKPVHPKTLTDSLSKLLKPVFGNVPYMGAHALRRTCAMVLLESGTDDVTTAEILGHDPATLKRIYARSNADLKRSGTERATRLFDPTAEKGA